MPPQMSTPSQSSELWLTLANHPSAQGLTDEERLEVFRQEVLALPPEARAQLPRDMQDLAYSVTPNASAMMGRAFAPQVQPQAPSGPTIGDLVAPMNRPALVNGQPPAEQAPAPDPRAVDLLQNLTQPTWGEQAAAMGIRTVPAVAGSALGGPVGAAIGGALGEAAAEYLVEGRDVNPWQAGVAGALNLVPGMSATGGATRLGLSAVENMGESALANNTIGGLLRAGGNGMLLSPVSTVGTNWAEGRPLTEHMGTNLLMGGAFGAATHGAIEAAGAAAPYVGRAVRQAGETVGDLMLAGDETGAVGDVARVRAERAQKMASAGTDEATQGASDTMSDAAPEPTLGEVIGGPASDTTRTTRRRTGSASSDAAQRHLELAPVTRDRGRLVVSNRVPTGDKAQPGIEGQPLSTGLAQVLESPRTTETMADRVRGYQIVTARQSRLSPRGVLEAAVETMQQNLQFLLDRMAPFAERSRLWYDGAHEVAKAIAGTDYTIDQGSGVIAVLSPQKDWHQNAELARQVVNTVREAQRGGLRFTQEVFDRYVTTSQASFESNLAKSVKDGKLDAARMPALRAEFAAELARDRAGYLDVPWELLPRAGRARFVRAYAELKNGQQYPILAPEGTIAQLVARNKPTAAQVKKGAPGKASMMGWQSYPMIEKALSILEDGSDANISMALGNEHKVRAFFNNINAPWSALASTVDTHQVAGSHVSPYAQSAREVNYSMGGVKNKALGLSGSNALYQEALARQSAINNLLPRELQSITWEGLKGMFSPEQKRNDALMKKVKSVWMDYRQGRRSLESTHEAILEISGGIDAPAWARER